MKKVKWEAKGIDLKFKIFKMSITLQKKEK